MAKSTNSNLYFEASRKKLRFESPIGLLTVEDVWTLPLTGKVGTANIDDMTKAAYAKYTENRTAIVSFIPGKDNRHAESDDQLRFEILQDIILVRVEEAEDAKIKANNAQKKKDILQLIAEKKNEGLRASSIEDLERMLAEIE